MAEEDGKTSVAPGCGPCGCCRLGRSVEADPGLVGQGGDPLGPQHRREGTKHVWQPLGRHHRHALGDHLAPRNLGAVDSHDRHHHVGIGQDLCGLVTLERHDLQGRARG